MTYQRREEIFSKEFISIADLMELYDISYNKAAEMIKEIKRNTDRLNINGKVHILDYLDYFRVSGDSMSRYAKDGNIIVG